MPKRASVHHAMRCCFAASLSPKMFNGGLDASAPATRSHRKPFFGTVCDTLGLSATDRTVTPTAHINVIILVVTLCSFHNLIKLKS